MVLKGGRSGKWTWSFEMGDGKEMGRRNGKGTEREKERGGKRGGREEEERSGK